eukprot:364692-Chlamydomonas_euryale.AAC.7
MLLGCPCLVATNVQNSIEFCTKASPPITRFITGLACGPPASMWTGPSTGSWATSAVCQATAWPSTDS